MGCFCSCFHVPNAEESAEADDSSNKNCICFNFLIQNIKDKYGAVFANGGLHAVTSSDQGPAACVNTTAEVDINRSHATSIPNSSSSRYSQLQLNVVGTRIDKGSGHSQAEPEQLEEPHVQVNPIIINGEDKAVASFHENGSEDYRSATSMNVLSVTGHTGVENVYPSSEEEDVCPTCLEEYTPENPKIITQCQHNYHLACIYEWMERSYTCPVCMKIMVFSEPT